MCVCVGVCVCVCVFVCLYVKTRVKLRDGNCENKETDTTNETNGGEQRQRDQRKKIEEAERRRLTSGYWSLTRHSKKETTIKHQVAVKEKELSGGSETVVL